MTEPTIPDYANLLRRAAANHAADATRYADREQKLTTELTRFEEWMQAEHARIQAELDEARRKADEQLRAIAVDWEARKRDLAEAGRAKTEHQKHATGAERAWRNWCHDEGISPDDLPPLRDTGPMPAIPAPAPGPQVVDLAPYVGSDVVLRTFGGTKIGGRLIQAAERAQVRQDDGTDCYVAVTDVAEVMRVTEILPPPGFDTSAPLVVTADPLPAIEEPDALLEAGRRAADPGATRVDAGGDQPAEGPFPGGVESPAGPRPKRPRRRPQSDRVTEQDGDA